VSDTLAQQHDNPAFQVAIQPVSITYLHRNLFRSDVLVTFNPAILVSAATHPGLASAPASEPAIRSLTTTIARDIKAGILDAPSWAVLRAAHTARRLYAPLGTKLALGEHVRLTQRFVEGLSDEGRRAEKEWAEGESVRGVLKTPMVLVEEKKAVDGGDYFGGGGGARATASSSTGPGTGTGPKLNDEAPRVESNLDVPALFRDLKVRFRGIRSGVFKWVPFIQSLTMLLSSLYVLQVYQDLLTLYGIKDDRVRNPRMLRRRTLLKRILVRFGGAAFLLAISLPGLLFWGPVFIVATRQSAKNARKGPAWE
jgi:glycerol-3-phosphate O-acyltransferase/dihydroxyacetone phosphate acyltransferase